MKTLTYNYESQEWVETDDGTTNPSLTSSEHLEILRIRRNQLLAETDIYGLSDVTMSDAMKTYRQALRDLPANTADPSNPTYPTKPS